MYLLHWRGRPPLGRPLDAFRELREAGKIRHWGVANFEAVDLAELITVVGGDAVELDMVPYNLAQRGIELELVPWCRDRGVPLLAYSPTGRGRLLEHVAVQAIALRHHVLPVQVCIAWVLRQPGVGVVPRAGNTALVRESRAALDLELSTEDLATLETVFPPPSEPQLLEPL
jgi:diketogulonate reductase-like aldo/keto reductase